MGKARKIFELAMLLFPEGPPTAHNPWVVSSIEDPSSYAKLLCALFKRNAPNTEFFFMRSPFWSICDVRGNNCFGSVI